VLAHGEIDEPLLALQAVPAAMRHRIGDRPGQRLNSLELIGMRVRSILAIGRQRRNSMAMATAPHPHLLIDRRAADPFHN